MKTTTIRITDEERQRIDEIQYLTKKVSGKKLRLGEILLAGIEVMEKPIKALIP